MRITNEILNRLAQDTVAQRTRSHRDLAAIYLQGSLLKNDSLLGGTADIDLFLIHIDPVEQEREIVRMTDDVHLDISHHSRSLYRQPKELRKHPWLGPLVYGCKILYDPQHFMDFTQASVRGQFNEPSNVLIRCRKLSEASRQTWFRLESLSGSPRLEDVKAYLEAVRDAANAVASLDGPPLTGRRFLLEYPERAGEQKYHALIGLLGGSTISPVNLREWLPDWQAAFEAVPSEKPPVRLHPARLNYYRRAFEEILSEEHPLAILWPLVYTWVLALNTLPRDSANCAAWNEAGSALGLWGEAFSERVAALDSFLDSVDETLEAWAKKNGG